MRILIILIVITSACQVQAIDFKDMPQIKEHMMKVVGKCFTSDNEHINVGKIIKDRQFDTLPEKDLVIFKKSLHCFLTEMHLFDDDLGILVNNIDNYAGKAYTQSILNCKISRKENQSIDDWAFVQWKCLLEIPKVKQKASPKEKKESKAETKEEL